MAVCRVLVHQNKLEHDTNCQYQVPTVVPTLVLVLCSRRLQRQRTLFSLDAVSAQGDSPVRVKRNATLRGWRLHSGIERQGYPASFFFSIGSTLVSMICGSRFTSRCISSRKTWAYFIVT